MCVCVCRCVWLVFNDILLWCSYPANEFRGYAQLYHLSVAVIPSEDADPAAGTAATPAQVMIEFIIRSELSTPKQNVGAGISGGGGGFSGGSSLAKPKPVHYPEAGGMGPARRLLLVAPGVIAPPQPPAGAAGAVSDKKTAAPAPAPAGGEAKVMSTLEWGGLLQRAIASATSHREQAQKNRKSTIERTQLAIAVEQWMLDLAAPGPGTSTGGAGTTGMPRVPSGADLSGRSGGSSGQKELEDIVNGTPSQQPAPTPTPLQAAAAVKPKIGGKAAPSPGGGKTAKAASPKKRSTKR